MNHTIRNIVFGALLAIGLGVPYLQAADVAISALPAGTTLVGNEAIPAVQTGATVKIMPSDIFTYVMTDSADTQVLYNNAGALDGDSGFSFNGTTDVATLTGGLGIGGSADVFIVRAAAGAASFRNGTSAQAVRVTDTYTDDSNNAYLELNAGAAGDWLQIRGVTKGTAGDNYGIALSPTGTGAISAHVPDSAAAGGNARGTNAVDWSTSRAVATQIASGSSSVLSGGLNNTASGSGSVVAGGYTNAATATYASIAGGETNTANGIHSWVPGGYQATARGLRATYAYSAGQRAAQGDAQVIGQPVRRTTTDATPVSLATDGTPAATTVMVLPASSTLMCDAMVVAQSGAGTDNAGYKISAVIQRDASNNTALVGTAATTTVAEDTAGMDATIVANDTLESAQIQVTGVTATTIYWVGELKCVQVL